MIRWVCPNCGSGTNAPERPRRNDVRRYCLNCSAATGLLVERVAPKLERQRAAAALRSQKKAVEKRARERDSKLTAVFDANGVERKVDVEKLARQALGDMKTSENRAKVARIGRCLELTVRRRTDGQYSGHAWPNWDRIVVSVGRHHGSYEDLLVLTYHEVAHLVAGADADDPRGRDWHGDRFQRTLAEALQKRWSFVRYGSLSQRSGYAPGWRVHEQLRQHVRAGGSL
jgi:hypothetical protein